MEIKLLNQIEVSRRWKVSERTLEAWRWRGKGPKFLRIGGRIRYRLEDIEQFERLQERGSDSGRSDG
jgi:predicted site-specific integrase-resolvase